MCWQAIGDAVRAARASGKPAAIVLQDGIHFLNETLVLTPEDSGTVIMPAAGASAWVSGGIPLALNWRKHGKTGQLDMYVADVPSDIVDIPALYAVGDGNYDGDARFGPKRFFKARSVADEVAACAFLPVRVVVTFQWHRAAQ